MDDSKPHRGQRWLQDHGDVLYRYALARVRQRDVAEDLVQETLLAALGAAARFENRSSEQTWLIGILRHKLADHVRTSARSLSQQAETSADDDYFFTSDGHWKKSLPSWGADPAKSLESRDFRRILRECLDKLPGRLAEIFLLSHVEEQSTDFLCKELGLSSTNVWSSLHRARMRLRECLNVNWFDSKALT